MKLFVDTNVFLDVWFGREGSEAAGAILEKISKGIYEGVVADITLLNIGYVAKNRQLVHEFIQKISDDFLVIGADNSVFQEALAMGNPDLEDNVQAVLAKKAECDVVLTRDLGFPYAGVAVVGYETFQ